MPTYDYECDACGHEMELFQRISEEPLKKCPSCKKNKLRRLFGTGAAIVFKGSGFYETDYRSESYKKGKEKAKENQSESGKESSGDSNSNSSSKSDSDSKTESNSKDSSSKKDATPSGNKKDR